MAEIVRFPPIRGKQSNILSILDVMDAFVEWNRKEKKLVNILKRENNVSYDWFHQVLSTFNLASTFPKTLRSDKTAQKKIAQILNDFRRDDKCTLDHVMVLAHELEKFTLYGKAKKTRHPLAAASLIMWFFNPHDIVIYDQQSRKGLAQLIKEEDLIFESELAITSEMEAEEEIAEEDMGFELEIFLPFDLHSYYDYHQCWIEMYLDRAGEIHRLSEDLYELCEFEGMISDVDYQPLREEWFYRQVFAKWLHKFVTLSPYK